jgi:hypothetical protein
VTDDSSSDDEDNFFSVKSFVPIINLCIHLNMVAQSLVIELFLTKERLVTENYSNITSQMVLHRAPSFSDEGL